MAAVGLADDLLVEILSRVPARSLCRFKCVSKDWLGLIEHPEHRKKLPQTLAGFFCTRSGNGELPLETQVRFASVLGKSCPPIDTSFAFLPSHRRLDLLDCCNGLLLCRWYDVSAHGDEFRYIVCNPATEQWVSLPRRRRVSKVGIVRLGFDPAVSSHFYVFVLLKNVEFNYYLGGVEVYSSETGRWDHKEERWGDSMELVTPQPADVFFNGCLHLHAYGRWSSCCLALVDTKGETWASLGIPGHLYGGFIQLSQGRLHGANFEKDRHDDVVRLVVYVLEEYANNAWILKHSVETPYLLGGANVVDSDRYK
ncbi:F-box protein At5g07610-like [Hordeum vulgare subsp. vulgare]|uniref:F-box protein At5g07610-like n=1 Tax=Hordeum vulgare subsp. vulgare TaxID=112509 RepID=UPI001D1A40F7|nr:F-box protein At5g07610-like [Hordeum vulgare subsp. vulgare]